MKDNAQKTIGLAEKLKTGHPRAVEEAIHFLNEDSYTPGSGYIKEECWRLLSRAPLSARQKARLQHAALKYLDRRLSREFWPMCRAMTELGDERFREQVDEWIGTHGQAARQRGRLLRAYLDGVEQGERMRLKCIKAAKSGAY